MDRDGGLEVEVPTRLTPKEGRKFAFTVGIAFAVIGAISAWRGHRIPPMVLFGLGGTLFLAGLVVPGKLGGVNRVWMGLAHRISKITAPIVMGIIYYVVMTPTGVLMRLFGNNPLAPRRRAGSFWTAPSNGGRSDLEKQF